MLVCHRSVGFRRELGNHVDQLRKYLLRACCPSSGFSARNATTSSSSRWHTRQQHDRYAKEARLEGFKSRAAYKLIELNRKHSLFEPGQTVVDLGFAPGSWSQIAVHHTRPNGRVIGIDIIPSQAPKGVSIIQGNFLSESVQEEVRKFVQISDRGRFHSLVSHDELDRNGSSVVSFNPRMLSPKYKKSKRLSSITLDPFNFLSLEEAVEDLKQKGDTGTVDVVLSDMMMNTSGNSFRDHIGSMDLCNAALRFASSTLRANGKFVCKFYQGTDDRELEKRLKSLFIKVYREKPISSRNESKEAYFVALSRKGRHNK